MGYLSIVLTVIAVVSVIPQVVVVVGQEQANEAMSREKELSQVISASEIWPADSGAASARDYFHVLVAKGALSAEDVSALRTQDFLIGNVSAADPAQTILIRTKPGLFSGGHVAVGFKNGELEVFPKEDQVTGSPAPRDPAYLSD